MAATDLSASGGCLCGSARFQVTGLSIWRTFCYCRSCCRSAAVPAVASACFNSSQFEITRGAVSTYESTKDVFRGFCGKCGSKISYQRPPTGRQEELNARPEEVYIATMSFDAPTLYPPEEHVRYIERVVWFHTSDALPRNEEFSAAHSFRQHQKPS